MNRREVVQLEIKVVSFMLGNERFAIDIMKVDSIVEPGKIIQVPDSSDYVEGLMNLRGTIIPVINLKKKFRLAESERKPSAKIVVGNVDEKRVGLLVDEVHEVLSVSDSQIEQPPSGIGGTQTNVVLGIAKLEDDMLMILNTDTILTLEDKIEISNLSQQEA